MRVRFRFIVCLFLLLLAFFVLQKPIFMLYNFPLLAGESAGSFLDVLVHGLSHDLAICAYLSAIPFLFLLFTTHCKSIPLRKIFTPYFIIICVALAAIFIGDTALYPYWKFKLDATIFTFLATPKQAVASVPVYQLILGILLWILLAFSLSLVLIKTTPRKLTRCSHPWTSMLLLLPLSGLLFLCIRGGVGKSTNNIGTVYFSDNQFLNHSAVNPAFSLFYSSLKQDNFKNECKFFDEETRSARFDSLYSQGKTLAPSLQFIKAKKPDILLIIMESFSGKFLSSLGGMKDVTPNLDSLAATGVSFTNCYANSFRTDRGLVSILSGYPGMPNATIMKLPNKGASLPSIASSLSRNGYNTQFVYGGDINFTNMSGYFLSTGFKTLVSENDFPYHERHTNAWGVNDEFTFKKVGEMVEKSLADTVPTLTSFLTLSSHDPFEVPYRKFDDKVQNCVSYTDHQLGLLMAKLRKSPHWNNLLVVCIADHGYCYANETNGQEPVSFKIPMIFTGGAVDKHLSIDKIINQSDFAAILLGQLGIAHDDFAFSRDVLSKDYIKPFAMYSFIDGFGFIDNTGTSVFDNRSQNVVYCNNADSVEHRLNSGKAIIQSMYKDISER